MRTTRVKLECGIVGDYGSHDPGDVLDLPAPLAKRMIDAGQCVEVATKAASENAATRTSKPQQRGVAHVSV